MYQILELRRAGLALNVKLALILFKVIHNFEKFI